MTVMVRLVMPGLPVLGIHAFGFSKEERRG
jgi:hypothetical protein